MSTTASTAMPTSSSSFVRIQTGKGKGKGGKARGKLFNKKVDCMLSLTKPAIRRLMRRGGVKRICGAVYEELRGVVKGFMLNVIKDATLYTKHARRKTLTAIDVDFALKRQGKTLYTQYGYNKK